MEIFIAALLGASFGVLLVLAALTQARQEARVWRNGYMSEAGELVEAWQRQQADPFANSCHVGNPYRQADPLAATQERLQHEAFDRGLARQKRLAAQDYRDWM